MNPTKNGVNSDASER